MVRAVNLTVAVSTAAVEEEDRGGSSWSARMLRCHVTARAESRIGDFEQPIVHRPVRLVTIGTIFHCRWMFPKEGAAPFGVTGVTVLIDAVLLQLSWAWAAMRIVTVAAGHLSLSDRHVRRT